MLAKGDCVLDEYKVRLWVGWHLHITLSLLALSLGPAGPGRRKSGGGEVDPADSPGGLEAFPPSGLAPTHHGRAGSGVD